MIGLSPFLDVHGAIKYFVPTSYCNLRIVGQETSGLFIFCYDAPKDPTTGLLSTNNQEQEYSKEDKEYIEKAEYMTNEDDKKCDDSLGGQSNNFCTHVAVHDPSLQQTRNVFVFTKVVIIAQATVNQEKTLLGFVVFTDLTSSTGTPATTSQPPQVDGAPRQRASHHRPSRIYSCYLAEIHPQNRLFSMNVDHGYKTELHFLYARRFLTKEKDTCLLVSLHRKFIGLYTIRMGQAGDGVIMSAQPRTQQIVSSFVWCQWDAPAQRLYYLRFKKPPSASRGIDPPEHVPYLTCKQFHDNQPYETIFDMAMAGTFPGLTRDLWNQWKYKASYSASPLEAGLCYRWLNIHVLTHNSGMVCVCYQFMPWLMDVDATNSPERKERSTYRGARHESENLEDDEEENLSFLEGGAEEAQDDGTFRPTLREVSSPRSTDARPQGRKVCVEYHVALLHHQKILHCSVSDQTEPYRVYFALHNDFLAVFGGSRLDMSGADASGSRTAGQGFSHLLDITLDHEPSAHHLLSPSPPRVQVVASSGLTRVPSSAASSALYQASTTVSQSPASSGQPPASSGQSPASSGQPPASLGHPPSSSGQPPASSGQPAVPSVQPPTRSVQLPASSGRPAVPSVQPPTRSVQPPASLGQSPSSVELPASVFEPREYPTSSAPEAHKSVAQPSAGDGQPTGVVSSMSASVRSGVNAHGLSKVMKVDTRSSDSCVSSGVIHESFISEASLDSTLPSSPPTVSKQSILTSHASSAEGKDLAASKGSSTAAIAPAKEAKHGASTARTPSSAKERSPQPRAAPVGRKAVVEVDEEDKIEEALVPFVYAASNTCSVNGEPLLFCPTTSSVFKLSVDKDALSRLFARTQSARLRVAVMHYATAHRHDLPLARKLVHSLWADVVSPEVPPLLSEFLTGYCYGAIKKQLPASCRNALLFPYTQLASVEPLVEKHGQGSSSTMTRVRTEDMARVAPCLPGRRPRHVKEPDLWTKLYSLVSTKAREGGVKLPPTRFDLRSVPPAPPANATPDFDGGHSPYNSDGVPSSADLSSGHSRSPTLFSVSLPFPKLDDNWRSDVLMARTVCLLAEHLAAHLPEKARSQARAMAVEYVACQYQASCLLCSLLTSGAGMEDTARSDRLPLLKRRASHRLKLFLQLLERYNISVNSVRFPYPAGFHSYFTCMAFICLPQSLFIQYVTNGVVAMSRDFIATLLQDLPQQGNSSAAHQEVTTGPHNTAHPGSGSSLWRTRQFLLTTALGQAADYSATAELLDMWQSPLADTAMARAAADRIFREYPTLDTLERRKFLSNVGEAVSPFTSDITEQQAPNSQHGHLSSDDLQLFPPLAAVLNFLKMADPNVNLGVIQRAAMHNTRKEFDDFFM